MDDLIILHLSDLHIDYKGRTYSRLLSKLLDDIKVEISGFYDKRVVVVVTGDIINQGKKDAISNAKLFFENLKKQLSDKVIAIYLVPGNHDKCRTDANKFLIPAYRSIMDNKASYNGKNTPVDERIGFDGRFANNMWTHQENSYIESGYYDLVDYIYDELFPDMSDIKKVVKKTYGVHVLEVKGKSYCFVLLNTAWSCIDDKDIRHIILGSFQLDYINDKFHELTGEMDIELTFVLGHHPLECLYGVEQDELFDKMISFNEMSANAYICGHTHDRTVINWSNNRHAIYTLMTGIGWPEAGGKHVRDHYYSYYSFNLDLNSLEITVKNSGDDGDFQTDLRIYTGPGDLAKNKLVRPIKFHEETGAIKFSTGIDIPSKVMYASNHFLNNCAEFARKLIEISVESKIWFEEDKEDFYSNYSFDMTSLESTKLSEEELDCLIYDHMSRSSVNSFDEYESDNIVEEIMKKNSVFIYDKFQGFLQKLCDKLEQRLIGEVEPEQVVRFHCRYLDRATYVYQELCSSFSHKVDREKYSLSDIKYGDLIEAIMENGKNQSGCLIYSLNKQLCKNKLKEKWKDFITIIPQVQGNTHRKKVGDNYKEAPFLTFGVTINSDEQEEVLYCMDYFGIHVVIGNILQTYINTFLIKIDKFCTWVKSDTTREVRKNDDI